MTKKTKQTVEARRSHTSMVLEARQAAVRLTGELNTTVQALRHSNAISVYLLQMMIDKAPEHDQSLRIPLSIYQKLQADDGTTVRIEYTKDEAIVRLSRASELVHPVTGRLPSEPALQHLPPPRTETGDLLREAARKTVLGPSFETVGYSRPTGVTVRDTPVIVLKPGETAPAHDKKCVTVRGALPDEDPRCDCGAEESAMLANLDRAAEAK